MNFKSPIAKKAKAIIRTIWAEGPQCVFRGDAKYSCAPFVDLPMSKQFEIDLVGVYDARVTLPQLIEDLEYFEKWSGHSYLMAVKVA